MKRNDINDLRTKTEDELKRMLVDSRQAVLRFKEEASLGKVSAKGESGAGVKNPNKAKNTKKDIARILTYLSIKQISERGVAKQS